MIEILAGSFHLQQLNLLLLLQHKVCIFPSGTRLLWRTENNKVSGFSKICSIPQLM